VVLLLREDFEELLSLSSHFRKFVFSGFGERLLDLLLLIDGLAFKRIDECLARLLVQRMGPDQEVEGTHRQIAEELGTVREVVSRRLKAMEDGGLVLLRRGGLRVVDLEGLRAQYCPQN
jgi:CRP/FNR family transcriptional regulator